MWKICIPRTNTKTNNSKIKFFIDRYFETCSCDMKFRNSARDFFSYNFISPSIFSIYKLEIRNIHKRVAKCIVNFFVNIQTPRESIFSNRLISPESLVRSQTRVSDFDENQWECTSHFFFLPLSFSSPIIRLDQINYGRLLKKHFSLPRR